MTVKKAMVTMVCVWLFACILALIPLGSHGYFEEFYSANGVCFPLHIHDPYLKGWQYSAFLFLGINTVGVFTISVCYTLIFVDVYKTREKSHTTRLVDLALTKRFFLIVLTDGACWIPIILLKCMALSQIPIAGKFIKKLL